MKKHVLTGAVKLAGRYVDESGAERQYILTRGQDVTALGLPHSVVLELIGKVRPMGGRRGNAIPYFTAVGEDVPAEPVDKTISIDTFNEAVHEGRIAAGIIEPDVPFDAETHEKETPQPEEVEGEPTGGMPATTPDEAAEAASAEPVVSPTTDEEQPTCPNPNCTAGGNTEGCSDENCPVNEAPVEPSEEEVVVEEEVAESVAEAPALCAATTKKGKPCKGKRVVDSEYCMSHQPK